MSLQIRINNKIDKLSCRLNQNFQLEFRRWIFSIFRRPQNREGRNFFTLNPSKTLPKQSLINQIYINCKTLLGFSNMCLLKVAHFDHKQNSPLSSDLVPPIYKIFNATVQIFYAKQFFANNEQYWTFNRFHFSVQLFVRNQKVVSFKEWI
jgi:hypothetical protein